MSAMRESYPACSGEGSTRREQLLQDFAAAWQRGERPTIDACVPMDAADRTDVVIALAHAELRYRLEAGDSARAEEYLTRFPALSADPQAALELIATEYRLRRQREADLTLESYLLRFPTYSEALRQRLQTAPNVDLSAATKPQTQASEAKTPPIALGRTRAEENPPLRAGRYQLQEELARGGMGVVWRARDPELDRVLALKVLLPRHQANRDAVARFRREAQITGQLQHPGIPPLHEVGTLADGRPFFAMKLIEGRTLAQLLRERATPAQDLPRFLGIFDQVCQTLAYAHSQGIIHRDLKPLNVMVGAFAEVQVMDWGLAKVVGDKCPMPSAHVEDADPLAQTADPGLWSQTGAVLGTPAYMSPEQARGEIAQLDERCDVFGLGAMLCVLLTGSPPYTGTARSEIVERAARGNQEDVQRRLEASGADRPLLELCQQCLAAQKEDRPRDAGVVAQAVSAYQTGVQQRLREAERQAAAAAAQAIEERKRRRVTVALAATVLLLMALASVGAWWVQQVALDRAERSGRTQREVMQALGEAAGHAAQARQLTGRPDQWKSALGLALAAARRAEGVLETGEADQALRAEVVRLRDELAGAERERQFFAELDDIRLRFADTTAGHIDVAGLLRRYDQAFRRQGLNVLTLPPAEAARQLQNRSQSERLLAVLGDWERKADPGKQEQLRKIIRLTDADPKSLGNRWQQGVQRKDRAALKPLAREAVDRRLVPAVLLNFASDLRSLDSADTAVWLLREGLTQYPGDFSLNFELAFTFDTMKPPGRDQAIRYYTVARALWPQSSLVHNNLANVLRAKGLVDEAIEALRRAIVLDPQSAAGYYNLGFAYKTKGLLNEAQAAARKAIELDPRFQPGHALLGFVLSQQGRADEAITVCRKAIALKLDDGPSFNNLGNALLKKGEVRAALDAFRTATKLKPDFASAYNGLGEAYTASRRLDEAVTAYRRAIELDPMLAFAHNNLGNALFEQGQIEEAIAAYRQAIAVNPNYANAYNGLGTALGKKGLLDEAVAACRKAIELDSKLPEARLTLGVMLRQQGQFRAALASFQCGLKLLGASDARRAAVNNLIRATEVLIENERRTR